MFGLRDIQRRQDKGDDTVNEADYPIPPDKPITVSGAASLSGWLPAESQSALPTPVLPASAVFYSTVINGQTSTLRATGGPTGAPVSTELTPDPAAFSVDIGSSINLYNDILPTAMESAMSTYETVGTVSVDTANPTLGAPTTPTTAPTVDTTSAATSAAPPAATSTTSGAKLTCALTSSWVLGSLGMVVCMLVL
jgi:hypothetical protein